MELLQSAALIVSLVAAKKIREAIFLLLLMMVWWVMTSYSVIYMSLDVQDDELVLTTFRDDDLPSRKRKRSRHVPVDDDSDDESDIFEFMNLCAYFTELLHAPQPRMPRRWWKDPTRPGNLLQKLEEWNNPRITSPAKADENYFKRFRVRRQLFNILLEHLQPLLPVHDHHPNLHTPLTPQAKLAVTMYWVAKGCHLNEVADTFNLGVTTVHFVIREVR